MASRLSAASLEGFLLYLTAFFGAFLAALWLSLVFWAYRDIRARTQDRLMHILAALVVVILGPAGLLIYLILRPRQTLDEIYQHTLEEEALLTEVEEKSACPGCGARTRSDWLVCPLCHTRLRKRCPKCSGVMDLTWKVCPYCATPAPGIREDHEAYELEYP